MHLEGTLEPKLLFELARRNRVQIPFTSVEAVRAAYNFSKLQDFLDIYYQGMSVCEPSRIFTTSRVRTSRGRGSHNIKRVLVVTRTGSTRTRRTPT